jgi:hypothetical protein
MRFFNRSSSSSGAHVLGHRPSLWITNKENVVGYSNPPRGPSAGKWVLTTANAAEPTATHPMTDQRCLGSAITRIIA